MSRRQKQHVVGTFLSPVCAKFAPGRRAALLASSVLAGFSLASPSTMAQVINVPAGTDLFTLAPPADGTVWNLLGGVTNSGMIALPTGSTGLTISGNSNTVTLTSAGQFTGSTSPAILTLSDITVTGGHSAAQGGVINSTGNLTINTTGAVAFSDNTSTFQGGAISRISDGGNLSISGGPITFSGNTAGTAGGTIYVQGLSNSLSITNSAITFTGNTTTGGVGDGGAIYSFPGIASSLSGGTISIGSADSTVTMTDNHAVGNGGAISIDGAGSILSINGSSITLSNNSTAPTTTGILGGGAIFSLNGDVSIGNPNSIVTLSGNSAATQGGAIDMNDANAPHTLSINGSSISITANHSARGGAILANSADTITIGNAGSTVTLSNNVATSGSGGAILGTISNIAIEGSSVALSNNRATAGGGAISGGSISLTASGTGNVLVTNNTVNGLMNGGAILVRENVTLNATGGDITFSGNTAAGTADAIRFNQATPTLFPTNEMTLIFNAAAGRTITFFDPISSLPFVSNTANNPLVGVTKTSPGVVLFDGSMPTTATYQANPWSQIYATTEVQDGIFGVRNNAIYGVLVADLSPAFAQTTPTNFTVDSGATLAGGIQGEVRADNFTLNGTFDISGSTALGSPAGTAAGGFSNFTVTSNNVSFGAGSQVLFNTYLNDASIQRTDLLTLTLNGSTTSGTAGILVTNVGGPGALTVGNGIELVHVTDNNGTTTGAFTLLNPELRPGAFDYRLFHGSVDTSGPENWYLRSTFFVGPPEPPPPEPPLPPTPPTPGPGTFPIIGPELATYGVVQPMAQQLGRAMLGTHDERLGDLYPVPCEPTAPIYTKAPPVYTKAPPVDCGTDGFRPAIWGRFFGQQIDNHYEAFADPRADGQIAGLQVGFDVLRGDSLIAGHKDYGGLYFAYGNANVDVSGLVTNAAATAFVLQHTGAVNLNAYSGGAYWTHYGPQGWYLDLTLQGTSYSDAASTEFAHLNTSGTGFISSLETGYPIALPLLGFGFVLEPQAQVLWQWVSFDAGNDGLGPVALGTTSETTARVGLKGRWTITTDSGQVWQPYVRTNYWNDFGGNAVTLFGVDSVPLISHAQYMDVDAGFTTRIDTHFSAFAEAGYQFAVSNDGGGKRDGVKGTAGLRYQW